MGYGNRLPQRKIQNQERTGGIHRDWDQANCLALTYKVSRAVDIPLLSMGGIYDWKDALEFIWAGASAVAIGTANFINPLAAPELIMGLGEYLLTQNKTLKDICGAASV